MRRRSAALTISLLAHGVAIALARLHEHASPPPIAPPPAAVSPPIATSDQPTIVDVVELAPTAGARPPTPHATARAREIGHASHASAPATSEPSAGSEPATTDTRGATSSAGGDGHELMHMRGGGDAPAIGQGLSAEFIDRFLAQSRPVPPKDTEAERIDDDLAADRAALNDPRWVANASPEALLAMRQKLVDDLDRRDHQELHPAGGGWFKSVHTVHDMTGREREALFADVAPDGTASLHDGGDGRYQPQEMAWLDKTRDDRVAIGKRHEREVLAHTPQYVQGNVEWAWHRGRDLATRKRDLFELWDECAESGDDAVVEAGATARLYVIAFIRSKLPAGSAGAYTAAELAALNAPAVEASVRAVRRVTTA